VKSLCLSLTLIGVALSSAGCDAPAREAPTETVALAPEGARPEAFAAVQPGAQSVAQAARSLTAIEGATHIPYPVYPNGSQYRVGGENGLKIVVFQTDDDFATVDAYYRGATDADDMQRRQAMQDFVRYGHRAASDDPWATDRPGIVIHEFGTDTERRAVGARRSARTNIIMSY